VVEIDPETRKAGNDKRLLHPLFREKMMRRAQGQNVDGLVSEPPARRSWSVNGIDFISYEDALERPQSRGYNYTLGRAASFDQLPCDHAKAKYGGHRGHHE
jgi:hypothetical protein